VHELQVYDVRFIARSKRLRYRGGDMVGGIIRSMSSVHKCVEVEDLDGACSRHSLSGGLRRNPTDPPSRLSHALHLSFPS
jgi:hypothetical protein